MRCTAASIALVAALVLAGCAGSKSSNSASDFNGAQKDVATTVEDLQSAAKDKDGAKICRDLITVKLQQQIATAATGKGCADAVDDAVKDTDAVDLTVKSVAIKGATATAVVRENTSDKGTDRSRTMTFEQQAGRWKISDLGASAT